MAVTIIDEEMGAFPDSRYMEEESCMGPQTFTEAEYGKLVDLMCQTHEENLSDRDYKCSFPEVDGYGEVLFELFQRAFDHIKPYFSS